MSVAKLSPLLLLALPLLVANCADSPEPAIETSVELGPEFDTFVQQAMDDWSVPGVLVIAVRQGSEPIIKSYGSRLPDSLAPITDQTLVQIASVTKSITGLALGVLVHEGLASWDDPVVNHISEFAVADPVASGAITLRDLVSHQAGLPGLIGRFFDPDRGIGDVIAALRGRQLSPGHRQGFRYSNVGFALAGEVVAQVSGMPWDEFIRTRLFEPLGMTSSYTSTAEFLAKEGIPIVERNMFFPALKVEGVVQAGSWDAIRCDAVYAPAGGVLATATDLSNWMEFLVGRGTFRGEPVVPSSVFEDVWQIQVDTEPSFALASHPTAPVSYASGWESFEHRGYRVLEHVGGWMSSVVAILPEAGLSVGVFTNAFFYERHPDESIMFVSALKLRALDHLLGEEPSDWSAEFKNALSG